MMLLAWILAMLAGTGDAERAYRANDYVEAARLYRAALATPHAAQGPLLFNLGSCAYRRGRYAEALLHYRRAALRMPDDPQVRFNIKKAGQQLGIHEVPAEPRAWFERLGSLGGRPLLAIAAVLQSIGLLGVITLRSRAWRLAAGATLAIGIVAAFRTIQLGTRPELVAGIVLSERIELKTEPHGDVATVVELRAGTTIQVLEHSDRWMHIRHEDGSGWTERASIGVIE